MRPKVAIITGVVIIGVPLGVSYLIATDNPPPRNAGAEVAVQMTLRDDGVQAERVQCAGEWCTVRLSGGTVRVQVEPSAEWPGWRIIPAHMP